MSKTNVGKHAIVLVDTSYPSFAVKGDKVLIVKEDSDSFWVTNANALNVSTRDTDIVKYSSRNHFKVLPDWDDI